MLGLVKIPLDLSRRREKVMVSGVCFSAFGAGGGRWEAFTLERSFEYIRHVCHLYA